MNEDTIAAISTAFGTGGIGIVRISGSRAFDIAGGIFKGKRSFSEAKSHTVNYGRIVVPHSGETVDEVLVVKMAAPDTFTREDVVEINCHGGIIVQKRILELVLRQGARLAEPGEFTKRAFLNGRLDLSQAEAVIDLINSKTDESSRAAVNQLEGRLSGRIKAARKKLIGLIAHIEVTVDYPEHDIEEATGIQVYGALGDIRRELVKTLEGFEKGRILREGVSTVIIGRPNVGKSSLLNGLTGKNRAIVTEIPGTTRDIIEEYINIRGIPLKITDTAGIRETQDIVERIGVEKTLKAIESADLIIFMISAEEGVREEDAAILARIRGKKVIVVVNKIDLVERVGNLGLPEGARIIMTSLKEETGLDELEREIGELFLAGSINAGGEVLVTNIRHKRLIDSAVESIDEARAAHENGMPLDLVTIDIKNAAEYLGQITGESVGEDVMNEIFSRFCVGK